MKLQRYTQTETLMGCGFKLGLVLDDPKRATELLTAGIAEIRRIEAVLTEFNETSMTGQLNYQAGGAAVEISEEFMQLMIRCKGLYRMTQGYFDPSAAVLKGIYRFDGQYARLPGNQQLNKQMELVGFDKIEFHTEKKQARLPVAGMRINFAAIGKGYAADRVRTIWQDAGVHGGIINASGDLCSFGKDEKGKDWTVGISDPDQEGRFILHLPISDRAIATSGNKYQYFIHQGKRYSHNLDPTTGKAISGIKSVSVISPSAELSDALATAIHAMGVRKGLGFANQLPSTHVVIIDDNNHIHFSKNLDYAATS
ncbi:FAD:protein FMN transferase [Aureitalea marina]|uniref:FAD:protein FMN transferase n=1 Tax=Aureitalea marina TaxID=930804 RepID=A0A2S7KMX9_9FLAO|nr:FAD:protein FMN transferase [Aureitalea marina]PQB03961.1 hypothetical protein BST85_02835 [Aureitalea marina]